MKPLLPSLREKNRYIIGEIIAERQSEGQLPAKSVENSIKKEYSRLFGELDASYSSMKFIPSNKNNMIIIKVKHTFVDKIRTVFCALHNVNNVPCTIMSKYVSGVLKKAKSTM